MIAKLWGVVDSVYCDQLILNVQGVGYGVFCPKRLLQTFQPQQEVVLWIEHLFHQDDQQLCGFVSYDEVRCFREILRVHGIGPKAALALLSEFSLAGLGEAIAMQDSKILTHADGIGPKAAARLVQELRNSKLLQSLRYTQQSDAGKHEVVEALISLGYDHALALNAVQSLNTTGKDSSQLLKDALAIITRG